jgi:hypothetical protein
VGIWHDVFLAPSEATLLDREAFGGLVLAFGRERIVRMPWFMIGGALDVNRTLLWSGGVVQQALTANPGDVLTSCRFEVGEDDRPLEHATVLARGDGILGAVAALAKAPYGHLDLAVIFSYLNFENPAIRRHFWDIEDRRTVLVCYALREPQRRVGTSSMGVYLAPKNRVVMRRDMWMYAWGLDPPKTRIPDVAQAPTHPVQTLVVNTFKHGYDEPCSAIDTVVSAHLGSRLVSGCLYH